MTARIESLIVSSLSLLWFRYVDDARPIYRAPYFMDTFIESAYIFQLTVAEVR